MENRKRETFCFVLYDDWQKNQGIQQGKSCCSLDVKRELLSFFLSFLPFQIGPRSLFATTEKQSRTWKHPISLDWQNVETIWWLVNTKIQLFVKKYKPLPETNTKDYFWKPIMLIIQIWTFSELQIYFLWNGSTHTVMVNWKKNVQTLSPGVKILKNKWRIKIQ